MPLEPGVRLGTFEVLGPLGAGGMGEVYRARDTKLGREVAIKVLPEAFGRDPMRVTRFEREARMLASVNHPAIAAIYGAEESGTLRYIVMELVPGDTLSSRMARGALPIGESLAFARQIAEALEAAHDKGVVHRDLKPANIKVMPNGRIKVLDLGLAKMMEEPPEPSDMSNSPTLTEREQTRPGVILGTVEFMSPEQARGKEVDKRTDIWAFGCILFEMISGRRAFTGETVSDVLAAILKNEPEWDALPAETPARIRDLLARCLQKDPAQRLRDIGDARMEIERTLEGDEGTRAEAARGRGARWRRGAAVAIFLLLLGGGAFWLLRRHGPGVEVETPAQKSLVVLPVKVLSNAPGGQLMGDGLADMLSARLSRVPGIQVVTPAAAIAASDKNRDAFVAARSVGADLVMNSSLFQSGDRVRITYSVWNVQTRKQVDGDNVDGSASDLLGIQDQLGDRVATGLKLPKLAKRTPTPSGLETASEQQRYVEALGNLQRYDKIRNVEEAIRILEGLVSERPNSPLVQAALGRAYAQKYELNQEKPWADKAITACENARRLDDQLPEVQATLGRILTLTGKAQEAIDRYEASLKLQPNSVDALLGLAEARDLAGKAKDAEATYRRAIGLQPSYWALYNNLGVFYYKHGNFRLAIAMFQRVVTLEPDSVRGYNNLGAAYQQTDQFENARDAYRNSVRIAPSDGSYSNLGTLEFFLGHYRESAQAFEKATQLTPSKALYWANLGDAYRWSSDMRPRSTPAYERAITLARERLSTNPQDAAALSTLGLCIAKMGKPEEGLRQIQHALELEPSNPDFLYDAAVASNILGRTDDAVDWIRRAVAAGLGTTQVQREPEFENLRSLDSFQRALRNVRKAA